MDWLMALAAAIAYALPALAGHRLPNRSAKRLLLPTRLWRACRQAAAARAPRVCRIFFFN